jgi:hypothetical protein
MLFLAKGTRSATLPADNEDCIGADVRIGSFTSSGLADDDFRYTPHNRTFLDPDRMSQTGQ